MTAELSGLPWARAHRTPVQMRYGDIDAMGHLNNAVYIQYLELARVELMQALDIWGDGRRGVVARIEMDYNREIRWGAAVVVETLIGRIGNSSVTVLSRVLADGEPCAQARTVQVHVDAGLKPERVPDDIRSKLRPYLVEAQP